MRLGKGVQQAVNARVATVDRAGSERAGPIVAGPGLKPAHRR